MAENQHHIVLELPDYGFDHKHVYMATLGELRAKGWKPSGDYKNFFDDTTEDESGKTFSEPFDGWDALGNDAWVSEATYPPTHKLLSRK
jgi:hypothetical protein